MISGTMGKRGYQFSYFSVAFDEPAGSFDSYFIFDP